MYSTKYLLTLCLEWVIPPNHWLILGGERQSGKTTILRVLARASARAGLPLCWASNLRTREVPDDLDPNVVWCLDAWEFPETLQMPANSHGLLTCDRANAYSIRDLPSHRLPFGPDAAVAWVDLRTPNVPAEIEEGIRRWHYEDSLGRQAVGDLLVRHHSWNARTINHPDFQAET